jgi:hypothetical protein
MGVAAPGRPRRKPSAGWWFSRRLGFGISLPRGGRLPAALGEGP